MPGLTAHRPRLWCLSGLRLLSPRLRSPLWSGGLTHRQLPGLGLSLLGGVLERLLLWRLRGLGWRSLEPGRRLARRLRLLVLSLWLACRLTLRLLWQLALRELLWLLTLGLLRWLARLWLLHWLAVRLPSQPALGLLWLSSVRRLLAGSLLVVCPLVRRVSSVVR